MPTKLSQQEFLYRLEQRNKKHPPVFLDPPNQIYVSQKAPLSFKCEFGHKWNGNLGNTIYIGRGCPQCKLTKMADLFRKPSDEVVASFIKVHGTTYCYNDMNYTSIHTPVNIKCFQHGIFSIAPTVHLSGVGCRKCFHEKTITNKTQKFVAAATLVHSSKYSYKFTQMEQIRKQITITCSIHGNFKQRPDDHLRGHGCQKCAKTSGSRKQRTWLRYIETQNPNKFIQHAGNIGEYIIPKTRYKADGFCAETNTVYEFHGDAFHGNLERYLPTTYCHPFDKSLTAQILNDRTKERECSILALGYNLISIWESDFDNLHLVPTDEYVNNNVQYAINDDIKEYGIELVDEMFKGYKINHNFRCLSCAKVFVSTLTQRKQAFSKYKSIGCPNCSRSK